MSDFRRRINVAVILLLML